MKRIVIKVGSNVLTRSNGKLDVTRMSAIVDQIAWLRQHDYEVILVMDAASYTSRRNSTRWSSGSCSLPWDRPS